MNQARRHGGTKARSEAATKRRSHKATKVRSVAIVTGSRAEYGLLRSTLEAISKHPSLRLQLVVTGTHLLKKFGHTVRDIERDGWRIDARVAMQRGDDGRLDQAEGLSRGVAGIARFLERARTDIVLVLGDRIEAMAGALAGVTTGRIVAHIHGGDVAPGDFDDSLRHAITKLAQVHLTATESSCRRVIQMGEDAARVHCVGAPGLDRLLEIVRETSVAPAAHSNIERPRGDNAPSLVASSPVARKALIVQHPCGRAVTVEKRVMEMVLRAVDAEGLNAVCLYPNSDRGHSGIVQAIERHARRVGRGAFRAIRSLEHDAYLDLLIETDVLIGNSSSGIIEAAAAGTPAVDIGSRQHGRERDEQCVFHAEEEPESIRAGLQRALSLGPIRDYAGPYGDGRAGERIAACLAEVALDESLRRKIFADHRDATALHCTLPQSPIRKAKGFIQTISRPQRDLLLPK